MLSDAQKYLHLKGDEESIIVFVCMDVEAIETPPNPISEVGISILDMKNVQGIPPGPGGSSWWRFIDSHHLRVEEYSGLRNYRFVIGCPNDFDFG